LNGVKRAAALSRKPACVPAGDWHADVELGVCPSRSRPRCAGESASRAKRSRSICSGRTRPKAFRYLRRRSAGRITTRGATARQRCCPRWWRV